jgi:UDP-N-acetylmuramate dehydrogenase
MQGLLKKNEPLAHYTSWWVGGKAKQCYLPADLNDLIHFLQKIEQEEPLLWLGLGSNVLIRDGGFPGTVIVTQGRLKELSHTEEGLVKAEAGVTCAKMAKYCARLNLAGATFFAGIPGTVGGALAMNAGAFGGETWPHVVAVDMINRQGLITQRQVSEFEVGYRHVVRPAEEWFVAGYFKFPAGDGKEALAAINALLKKRGETQPIGLPSCGSVFRNPPGDHAARLIEAAGLKGKRMGGAWVSEKHANFIINDKNASAADIENLISYVAAEVERQQGVKLIHEVHIIGERV